MITVAQLINELLNPVLGLVGVVLRAIGALGAGLVVGSILRHGLEHKMKARFFLPLVLLAAVALFWSAASGQWSSPGTVAMLGIGLFVGFQYMRSLPQAEQDQASDD